MATKPPTFDRLMNPLLRALRSLGGSGSVEGIYDKVVELEKLLDDVLSQFHDPEKSNQTEVAYRLAWARTYLKKYGLLENSTRGVWALTAKAKETEQVDPQDVVKTVRALDKKEAPERRTPGRPPGRGFRRRGVETEATRHPDTEALPTAAFERLFSVFSFSAFVAACGGPRQHRGPRGFPSLRCDRGWLLPHCTSVEQHCETRAGEECQYHGDYTARNIGPGSRR